MKWKAYSPAKFFLTQNKYVDLESKKVAYVLVCNRHPRCRSVLQFIIHPCDPTVVICYLIWPCDIAVCITYLISHSSSFSYNTVIKGYFRLGV